MISFTIRGGRRAGGGRPLRLAAFAALLAVVGLAGPGALRGTTGAVAAGPAARRDPGAARGRFADPGASLRGEEPTPPADVAGVVAQVHFAFRPEGGAWRGGHTTYAAERREDGSLEVTPFHIPAPARRARGAPGREAVSGAPVRLGPAALSRDGLRLDDVAGVVASDRRGGLEIRRGAVVEQLANRPEGVEVAWRLDAAPAGRGDVEVRIPVAEGAFLGETEGGLHFGGGALGVRFGHGTWIDAAGIETPVPARWTGTEIALRVPAAVVDGSAFPAVLDPVLGPEQGFDTPTFGGDHGDTASPAVSWDGESWLVVWSDRMLLGPELRGTRVRGSDGAILDPLGLTLTPPSAVAGPHVALAWNPSASAHLLVWEDERDAAANLGDLYGSLVGADGARIGADAFVVAVASTSQQAPAAAALGAGFVVVWEDFRNQASSSVDVYGALVSGAGAADPFAVSSAASSQVSPAIACGGSGCLVAWQDSRYATSAFSTWPDVFGARLDASGILLDPAGFPVALASGSLAPGTQREPAVTWNGSAGEYLVVWSDGRVYGRSTVYGARVTGAGAVLDASGIPIGPPAVDGYHPDVVWNGSRYVVAWIQGAAEVRARAVTDTGVPEGADGFPVASADGPVAALRARAGGPDVLLAWNAWPNLSHADVLSARLSGALSLQDAPPRPLSMGIADQEQPDVATDGTDFLLVWRDYRADMSDIYGARVRGADGVVLDPLGFSIATAPGRQRMPAVAWDGSAYVVVWGDYRSDGAGDIYGARVLPDATVLDSTAPLAVRTGGAGQDDPDVACHAGTCLAVWPEFTGLSYDVHAAPLTGGTVGPLRIVANQSEDEWAPRVAWSPGGWLVVWEASGSAKVGRLPDGGGAVAAADLASAVGQNGPAIACDAVSCLAVWADTRSGTNAIYGRRVSGAGAPFDAEVLITSATGVWVGGAAIASNGQHYLVAWGGAGGDGGDLHATRVTSHGRVLDGEEFVLAGSWRYEGGATLAGAGDAFVAGWESSDLVTTAAVASRVRLRRLGVTRTNDPPTALAVSGTTAEDAALDVALAATDLDGDPVTYTIATPPTHGSVTIFGPAARYVPEANWHGADAFTFRATDGLAATSGPATASLTVTPVNDAPVAAPMSLVVAEGATLQITLTGTDVDGDAMGFTVLTPPAHGTLSGTAPTLAYAPAAGFSGEDAFTFRVSDGQAGSAPASVTIRVGDPKPVKSAYGCSSGGGASPVLLLGGLALLVRGGRGRRRVVALALAVALPCAPLAATSSPSSGRNGATRQAAPPAKPPADVPLPPPPPGTIQVAPAPMPPAPAAARPAPAAAKGARVRVAVMPIRAGPGVDRGIAGLVTDALVAELADRGLQTITAKDVESALGFERQKQLLGCGDSACLADVAGALGADRVVFGDVAQVRELTVFSAQVFNTRAGAVERRFHERLTGGDAADLLEATDRAAGTLFPETARSGTASRRRSTTFSAARPLAVVLRGGYDVRDPGGFGAAAVEYRVSRALRVGAGALMAGSQAAGALLRAGWYPLVLGGTSIYAAAEGQVLFPGEPVVAAHLGLGVEWALGQRLAVSLEAPVTILASAPAEYRSTYFMPGGSVSWRF